MILGDTPIVVQRSPLVLALDQHPRHRFGAAIEDTHR